MYTEPTTVNHAWVSDSIRCALQRLSEKPYDAVGQREQYDALIELHNLEHTHRIRVYQQTYIQAGPKKSVTPSTLDQLLQSIQQPPTR